MKNVNDNELKQIVKESKSWADLCRALELRPRGANYYKVQDLVKEKNLNTSHFNVGA